MAEAPRVGIVANLSKSGAKELMADLLDRFEKASIEVILDDRTSDFIGQPGGLPLPELSDAVDILVVLGGDGTILWVLRQLEDRIKPIAAINTGTLGFLTCATEEESGKLVEALATGNYQRTDRIVIRGEFLHDGEVKHEFVALNEVTFSRGVGARVIHVEAWVDGRMANRYTGDGLIVATPTGSTAYSLSAGGPLVQPGANVFVVTPVCPHTLADRPLVVGAASLVSLKAPEQRDDLALYIDGRLTAEVSDPAEVRLKLADFQLPLISLPDQNFFTVLHRKMGWAGSAV
ncbi:MAG: NAD(+)/NADH kinase [Verrucomicrobiales bacterium]